MNLKLLNHVRPVTFPSKTVQNIISDEEIKSGLLADLMIDEDFNFEEMVSLLPYGLESVIYWMWLNDKPEFVPSLHFIFLYYVPSSPKI